MNTIGEKGEFEEELYSEAEEPEQSESKNVISSIDNEIKTYLKKCPEKLYDLSPRKFEER